MGVSADSGYSPRLIVHLGSRKTGTTYIQNALGLNERRLSAAGVYMPRAGRFDLNPTNVSHHHLAFELGENSRFRPELGGWDDLRNELARERPETVLISCEVFESIIVEGGSGPALLEQVKSLSSDVTLVLVVREWTAFINSMYNQAVKMFAIAYPFAQYVKANIDNGSTKFSRHYSPFLDDPDIRFVALRYSELQDPDPLTAMLRAGGIRIDTSDFRRPVGRVNTSLGAIGLEVTMMLGMYMNSRYDEWHWRSPQVQQLHIKNLVATDERGWNQGQFWGWSPELLDQYLPVISKDTNEFARRLWGRDWPESLRSDRPRLVSDFEHYPPDLLSEALDHIEDMRREYLEIVKA